MGAGKRNGVTSTAGAAPWGRLHSLADEKPSQGQPAGSGRPLQKTRPSCEVTHGDGALRPTPSTFKTALCIWYERGRCRRGQRCQFAHGWSELRGSAADAGQWPEQPGGWEAGGWPDLDIAPVKVPPILGNVPPDQPPGPASLRRGAPRAQERAQRPAPRAGMVEELKMSLQSQWNEAVAVKAQAAMARDAPPERPAPFSADDVKRLRQNVQTLSQTCAQLQQQMQALAALQPPMKLPGPPAAGAAAPPDASVHFDAGSAVSAAQTTVDQVMKTLWAVPPGLLGQDTEAPESPR